MMSGFGPTTSNPEPKPTRKRSSVLRAPELPILEEVDSACSQDGKDDDVFNNNSNSAGCRWENETMNDQRNAAAMQPMTREISLRCREIMKAKITYHFMNPFQKYRARRRKPWKFLIQLFKIIIITIQVWLFGTDRFSFATFLEDNRETMRYLFLKDYRGVDVNVYTREEFFDYLHYAHEQYYQITTIPIGTFDYTTNIEIIGNHIPPVILCQRHYEGGTVNLTSQTYNISTKIIRECSALPYPKDNKHLTGNSSFVFSQIIEVDLNFSITSVNVKGVRAWDKPACYRFDVQISFDNSRQDGKIPVTLNMSSTWLPCQNGRIQYSQGRPNLIRDVLIVFDGVVVVICGISLVLSLRAAYRSLRLSKEVLEFFKTEFQEDIGWSGRLEFLNMWLIVIISSDCLTIIGSVYKMAIDQKDNDFYDVCSLFLGSAVLFVWIGLLRFLGYFEKYNTLLVTLKAATPSVLRFFFCTALLFAGFMLCGWIVLGPLHPKFRTVTITAECLYSLVNGDDMYMTFAELSNSNLAVWIFSKVYLYTFICLFIYIVLSLFIGIISDTYERLKDMGHLPRTRIQEFILDQGVRQAPRRHVTPLDSSGTASGESRNLIRRVSMESTGGE